MASRGNVEDFIKKSRKIHGNKYNYNYVKYINATTKIEIECKLHGIFLQSPMKHLYNRGCPKCSHNLKLTTNDFIKNAKNIHGNTYDYSLVEYKNNKSKVKIVCKNHGIFLQSYSSHISNKKTCPKCSKEITNLNSCIKFFRKCNIVHNSKYDYSKSIYKGFDYKIEIVCNIHGSFWQKSGNHLTKMQGCPNCIKISKGEKTLSEFLKRKNINYISQMRFKECIDKQKLPFDFYIPEKNICIEFDGIIHFEPVKFMGGEEKFIDRKRKDNIKNQFCINNKINLIRIPYNKINNIEDILSTFLD